MQFNVGQLLREPIGTTSKYNLDEAVDPLEDGTREAVRGWVRLTRTDKGIWVLGALETGALGICSRCLDSYRQGVKLSLDDQYYPLSDPLSGARTPVSLLDQGFTIDARHVLDLRENVRQACHCQFPDEAVVPAPAAGASATSAVRGSTSRRAGARRST